jgi:addiction module RelB/DinJ family antitoxin
LTDAALCYISAANAGSAKEAVMAQVNIRIDSKLKEEGEKLFRELGLTFSSAVSVFVSQAVRERGIPFRLTENRVKDITLASEKSLAKDWLLPEENTAWRDL